MEIITGYELMIGDVVILIGNIYMVTLEIISVSDPGLEWSFDKIIGKELKSSRKRYHDTQYSLFPDMIYIRLNNEEIMTYLL